MIWSDNTGAEHSFKKGARRVRAQKECTQVLLAGTAKQFDHCSLIHAMWKHLLQLGTEVHVMRVPTDDNVADNPSRFLAAADAQA